MKCQIIFSGKNKNNISECHLLKFFPIMLSVKNKFLLEPTIASPDQPRYLLTHCTLNELPNTIWKILISILGMSGYVI